MTDPAEDLAQELAEDALLEKCPAGELPAWPRNALIGCLSNGEIDRLPQPKEEKS